MKLNSGSIAFAVALLVLTGFVVPTATVSAATTPLESRKAAPDFTLTDVNGRPFTLSEFKGKVVLLDFWATWCHGCKTEIPWYIEFQNKYKNQGLSVIGVSMDDDGWKSVRPFLQEHDVNYLIGIGTEALGKQYNVVSMPVTLLIDRQGRIAESHSGMVDRQAFEQDIQELLRERSD